MVTNLMWTMVLIFLLVSDNLLAKEVSLPKEAVERVCQLTLDLESLRKEAFSNIEESLCEGRDCAP